MGPVDAVLGRYRRWLERERCLGEQTVELRMHWAGQFLIAQVDSRRLELDRIGPEAVTAFVLDMSKLYAVSSMKPLTSGVRSLLRSYSPAAIWSTTCHRWFRRWPAGS